MDIDKMYEKVLLHKQQLQSTLGFLEYLRKELEEFKKKVDKEV